MRCDDVRVILGESPTGEVPENVRGHLDGCAECSSWWREWRMVSAGFRALAAETVPEPSLEFSRRVLRRLEEGAEPRWGAGDFFERAGRRVVWATLLVTLTLLLAIVLPSSGPVRGPGESEFLLAGSEVATVRTQPIIDMDSVDFSELAPESRGTK